MKTSDIFDKFKNMSLTHSKIFFVYKLCLRMLLIRYSLDIRYWGYFITILIKKRVQLMRRTENMVLL